MIGNPIPDAIKALAPRHWRQAYIRFWISKNLPYRLAARQKLIGVLFSLALQDSFGDVRHALIEMRRQKKL